jgi:hypothetical protein
MNVPQCYVICTLPVLFDVPCNILRSLTYIFLSCFTLNSRFIYSQCIVILVNFVLRIILFLIALFSFR